MKQILHIFAKDARHFWIETLLSVVLLATYVWITPSTWGSSDTSHVLAGTSLSFPQEAQLVSLFLALLITVSWWLIIARVVHAEGLVGDRQFWLTRPYEWKNLLLAKLLFLVVFLCLPLLLAQASLLFQAGYPPLSFVAGLLFKLLLVTGTLGVPLFALATVTATFARLTLTLLAGLAMFIAYLTVSLLVSENAGIPVNGLSYPLCLSVCGIVVVLQYSTRRVWRARLLLIGLPVLLVLAGLAVPPAAIDRDYANVRPGQPPPLQFVPFEDPKHPVTAGVMRGGKQVFLNIPVTVSGVAAGYAIVPDRVKVTIDAANGRHWASAWQPVNTQHYLPGAVKSSVSVALDRPFLEQVRSTPVRLHFTFALIQLRSGEVRTVPLSTHDFSVPDFGICSPQTNASNRLSGIACRFALHPPRLTYISVVWPDSPCSASPAAPYTGVLGDDWVGTLAPTPAEFGISPVEKPQMGFSNATNGEGEDAEARSLCPGTAITFTQYNLAQHLKYEMTMADFRLPTYQDNGEPSTGLGGYSFSVQ